jgi:hypothetical protein
LSNPHGPSGDIGGLMVVGDNDITNPISSRSWKTAAG